MFTLTKNIQNMKHVHIAQIPYVEHFLAIYNLKHIGFFLNMKVLDAKKQCYIKL